MACETEFDAWMDAETAVMVAEAEAQAAYDAWVACEMMEMAAASSPQMQVSLTSEQKKKIRQVCDNLAKQISQQESRLKACEKLLAAT